MAANFADHSAGHKPVLALTSMERGFYIAHMKWRNQLLALFCLVVFFAFGVFYFRYWVIQKPFGIVLFIGGGLDANRIAMARLPALETDGTLRPLAFDTLPYAALLRNSSKDSASPDLAAVATALATGVKVKNGVIATDSEGTPLTNLLDLARESGRMTGLVTNGDLTDVTVASFYAHVPAGAPREELARLLAESETIDVVLSRETANFIPLEQGGRRSDGRDLLKELADADYSLVRTLEELDEIPRWRRAKLFGFLAEAEPSPAESSASADQRPDLPAMVRRAIELLQFNRGGYLLVVDAGAMRQAAEEGDTARITATTLELDRAIAVALEYVGTKSAIVVCGDRTMRAPDDRPQSPEDVLAFGKGPGVDALHGVLENTAIFEIIQDNL